MVTAPSPLLSLEVIVVSERVPLDVRVSVVAKERFETALRDEYGAENSYGGFVLEQELRTVLDRGDIAAVRDAVESVADALDVEGCEKKSSERPSREETVVVRYRVSKDVRDEIMELIQPQDSDEYGDYRSPGEFVESIMWRYAESGSRLSRVVEKLDDIHDAVEAEQETESMSTTEEIATQLGDQFNRGDFLEAASAAGVGTEKYALSEYLPKVLDEMDAYAHPDQGGELFVPRDSDMVPDTPDPATLPYQAMDDADKRLALKTEAIRKVGEAESSHYKFTVSEAIDTLHGRPRPSTVRPLLRDIANEGENGLIFDDDIPGLTVSIQDARVATDRNDVALAILGWEEAGVETDASAPSEETADDAVTAADDTDTEQWVERAADSVEEFCESEDLAPGAVSDRVLNNKIARAMQPDQFPEFPDADDLPNVSELVDTEDRDRVVAELTGDEPDTVRAEVKREEAEPTMDELTDAVEAEPSEVVTDGGFEETPPDEVDEEFDRVLSGHPEENGPGE